MQDHWGIQTRRGRVIFGLLVLIPLAGCAYSGPIEGPAPSPSQRATEPPRSLEENIDEVARLLDASTSDPGMPSAAEPAGKLSAVLAPGDYKVTGACAGVYGAKLTIVRGGGFPEATDFKCGAGLERFFRHTGGPVTVSAVPATDTAAAAGLTLKPNTDPQASALEDMAEWASQQLKPVLPGELDGYTASDSPTRFGTSAKPGAYGLHFTCEGPAGAEFSLVSWSGAEVLAPVQVHCDGDIFKTTVRLGAGTEGVDFKMSPGDGRETRYAFRLVPST